MGYCFRVRTYEQGWDSGKWNSVVLDGTSNHKEAGARGCAVVVEQSEK